MTDSARISVTVSVVSHGQGNLVASLLEDLSRCSNAIQIVVTQNIPEDDIPCPKPLVQRMRVIRNRHPLGFGANHNQAFMLCETELFAVINPDIRLEGDPFPQLVHALEMSCGGVIGPAVKNPKGDIEDSARHFPTPLQLFRKLMGLGGGCIVFEGEAQQDVDWTAGMFLIFPAVTYREIGGFDENFFLYYEDVDICVRLWRSGRRVLHHPGVTVIHAAQRTSRKNFRYMAWHLSSMLRYFAKHMWHLPR